jgi:hypothetical protein
MTDVRRSPRAYMRANLTLQELRHEKDDSIMKDFVSVSVVTQGSYRGDKKVWS